MLYQDKVYGESAIEEPVILGLMGCPALTRLKDIDQAGYFEPHFPGSKHSRFEHSVGDYLLLKKFNASLEEQIAGLIHDVSHSVFSHCVDYMNSHGSGAKQDHQDKAHKGYVLNSELPEIFKKFGLDTEFILDDVNFPLQENDLPDICADRIDYILRDIIAFKIGTNEDVEFLLKNLSVMDNKWVFKNIDSAKAFAEFFYKINSVCYSGLTTAIMFKTVGDYCDHALSKGYIIPQDLYTTDTEVLNKINSHLSDDKELENFWRRMHDPKCAINDPGTGHEMKLKSRIVDPLFIDNGGIKRYSEVDEKWQEVIASELKPKEYFLKFKY
jgi:uncharacterized protein